MDEMITIRFITSIVKEYYTLYYTILIVIQSIIINY